jgi:MFS family permease
MVGREDVANAVALNSAVFNAARIVGPAIAGLTIGFFGGNVAVAFLVNGLSFVAVLAAYAFMRNDDLHSPPRLIRPRTLADVGGSLAEGLRYVRRTEMVLLATVTVAVASTFGMNFGVTIPALAREVLLTDATGYGFLMAASGIGSLAAALGIAFSGRSRPAIIPIGALVLGVGLLAASLIHVFAFALLAMVLVGFGAIGMAATANTVVQLAVPDELRGRVISVYTTVFVGSTPVGGLLMGAIASTWSVEASLALSGVGCLVTGALSLAWLRRIKGPAMFKAVSPGPTPGSRAAGGAGARDVRVGGTSPVRPR